MSAKIQFGVITAIVSWDGNTCDEIGIPIKDEGGYEVVSMVEVLKMDSEQFLKQPKVVHIHAPVFELGEILVINAMGRCFGSRDRKPSQWDVFCEYFDNVEDAIKRSKQVMKEHYERQNKNTG